MTSIHETEQKNSKEIFKNNSTAVVEDEITKFLEQRKAHLIQQHSKQKYLTYNFSFKSGKQLLLKSIIKKRIGYNFSLTFKLNPQKIERGISAILQKIQIYERDKQLMGSKLCFIQKTNELQLSTCFRDILQNENTFLYGKQVQNNLQRNEQSLISFIKLLKKQQKPTSKKLLFSLRERIETLKIIVQEQIRTRQGNNLPILNSYELNLTNINIQVQKSQQKNTVKKQTLESISNQIGDELNQAKLSDGDDKILRKIQIEKIQEDKKWISPQSSFGLIKRLYVEGKIVIESIYNMTNQYMKDTINIEWTKQPFKGYLVKKQAKNRYNSGSVESLNTQTNLFKFLRNQKQKTIASYFIPIDISVEDQIQSFYMSYYSKTLKQYNSGQKQGLFILTMLARSLRFLQGNYLLHRDLKPANIMVADNIFPKLIDFGSAYSLKANLYSSQMSEILRTSRKYNMVYGNFSSSLNLDQKSFQQHRFFDMHAFGVMIKQILLDRDQSGKLGIVLRKHLSWLVHRCIDGNPDNRIGGCESFIFMVMLSKFWKVQKGNQNK